MAYGRARLISALAVTVALPLHRVWAQAELPLVLRGSSAGARAGGPPDAALTIPADPGLGGGPAVISGPTGAGPAPDLARPFAMFSVSMRSLRDSLVAVARAQIGRRYRFGGASPEHGFDCSGLVRYVMAALHVDLPRTAKEQARSGALLPRDTAQLRPGDLVTFGSTHQISHIGIYVGDGRFVQASSKAGRVIETRLLNRPHAPGVKPWRGARRVMPAADSTGRFDDSGLSGRDDDG
jgi:cell wall-associated NlpC family hydrolase